MTKPSAPGSRTRMPKGAQPGTLRYWQARMELTIGAMERGQITSQECERRCRVYEQAMRTQTHLKTLTTLGVVDEADPITAELEDETPALAVERIVTVKRGNSAKGPIDETTVVTHETAAGE